MNDDLGRDLDVSHNVLNYLHAICQGYFACLNMLSQLGFHAFNPDMLGDCQDHLAFLSKLSGQLTKGIPVFSMTWKQPQTSDSKELLSRVAHFRVELLHTANNLQKILIDANNLQNSENVKYLVGAFAWFAYTNENYIKGFIEYGKSFTIPELVKSYEAILPQAEQNIQAAHLFFDIYTGEGEPNAVFYQSLYEEALFLPGMFRTNVHDLDKFLVLYQQPLQFSQTEIPPEEAEEWRVINIDPDLAGYWHAFGFRARDMIDWVQVGVHAPRLAWFWSCLQFNAESAREWMQQGFNPPMAREWSNYEFTAAEAIDHIQRGLNNPQTAKEEGKKIIIED